jgi:hypothetical protein
MAMRTAKMSVKTVRMSDQILIEDGDEGYGKESGSDHMIQNLRKQEGKLIGIHIPSCTACAGDKNFPKKTGKATQEYRRHHDEGGDTDLFV